MPVSITAASCSAMSRSSVSGAPISLLRFPSVRSVSYFCASTAAIISLVVVLPTEPVTCTTGSRNCPRYQAASAFSASRVSGT